MLEMHGDGEGLIGSADLPMIPLVAKSMPMPSSADVTPRERVMGLFDQGLRKKMTFVCADEGFGKSTALADWHRRRLDSGALSVWFTADRHDRDPERFWMNFVYAVTAALGEEAFVESKDAWGRSRHAAVWMLSNDLCAIAAREGGLSIIVEGFDTLRGSMSIEEFMLMASALSYDVHLYLSSRLVFTKHSFESVRIIEAPLFIGASDLSFTLEELTEVMRDRLGRRFTEEVANIIFEKTEGWPYGALEAVDYLAASEDPLAAARDFSGTIEPLWEFFDHEVYAGLAPDEQSFLLRVALLGRLDARLCGYALDDRDAGKKLNALSRKSTFLHPENARRAAFAMLPLFCDWLEEKALDLPVSERRILSQRAARWYARHGFMVEAAQHQILATERADVFNLARAAFPQLTSGDLADSVKFRTVPPESELDPCFLLLAAWSYVFSAELENASYWLERLEGLDPSLKTKELSYSILVIRVKLLCLSSRFDEGIMLADEVDARFGDSCSEATRIMLLNCRAEACDLCGDLTGGMQWHKGMNALTEGCRLDYMEAINLYEMAYAFFLQCEMARALQLCRRIDGSFADDYPVHGAVLSLCGLIRALQGDFEEAEALLDRAHSFVAKNRNADMYLDWCNARAWLSALQNGIDRAEEILLEASEAVRFSAHVVPRGAACLPFQSRALLKTLTGDGDAASAVLREFDALGIGETALMRIVREHAEIMGAGDGGDPDRLASLADRAQACGFWLVVLRVRLRCASRLYEQGKRAKAMRALDDVIKLASSEDIVGLFCGLGGGPARRLLSAYLASVKTSGANRRFVRRLLKLPEFDNWETGDLAEAVDVTAREKEVLALVMSGCSRSEIASELCVSEGTVKSHLSHLYAKFNVNRLADLLDRASDLGCFGD